jgi:hypothetical protein
MRLRAREALERMADGEGNLARLAAVSASRIKAISVG